ncbi:hypothetical protein SAY87_020920 [Trapa incisa]|uniref:PetM of cytochrome b6/f complex subunit 7 n=2 Tax=Trapa TaxID=22665 RepID=A0AAN7RIB2_TRANT|nr:hypothetical protein SAY87_020920 [Trapa incisa]KAK4805037.1 hypothetical protein SAY86_004854 [Trapa natans]
MKMAAVAAAATASATPFTTTRMPPKAPVVRYVGGMNSFGGLKASNCVSSLGVSASTEQSFANFVSSMRPSNGRAGKGGASGSTCNAAGEIFRIAAIMNGLVLIGVAVGFVLLRIEASLEESE